MNDLHAEQSALVDKHFPSRWFSASQRGTAMALVMDAQAAATARAERLEKALSDVSEVAYSLVEGEQCEHDVGICWCHAYAAIDAARAALTGGAEG